MALGKPARAATTRGSVLASFHSALVQLETRRATAPTDARPADAPPADALPGDGLLRLAPSAAPNDAAALVPAARDGERFHYHGSATGEAATEEEFPIDWPEPGAVAVAEITARTAGRLTVTPMTRTLDRVRTHEAIIDAWFSRADQVLRVRRPVPREMTHLKVTGKDGDHAWSIHLLGPSDLDELAEQRQGNGTEVLAVTSGTPVQVMCHVKSGNFWTVEFLCGCWAGTACRCGTPADRDLATSVYGGGEGAELLTVPRPGLLVIHVANSDDPWKLTTRPVGAEPDQG